MPWCRLCCLTPSAVGTHDQDPRAVQQLVAFLVVPIVLIGAGQTTGLFLVNAAMISLGALLVLLIDAGLLVLAVRLFQRETILTQWR